MAIVKSLAIGKAKGSAGNLTFTYLGGDTIAKGKVAFPKVPRTYRQMVRRAQWGNIVNFWQATSNALHPSFQGAGGRVSDFNLFMARNLNVPVYLQKSVAASGGVVVAPYMVTEGELTPIMLEPQGAGVLQSSIALGSLVINDETTLSAFSAAVKTNNSGFEYGDQISAFVFIQSVDTATNVPKMSMKKFEITLSEDSEDLVVDFLGNDPTAFTVSAAGKLGLASVINGGAVYIHSRYDAATGKTLVSTQHVVCTNDLLTSYQTETALNATIQSYGGKIESAFLTPNIETPLAPTNP